MPVYTGEDFSGQTVTLTEQTRFVRCILDGANIVDGNGTIGYDILDNCSATNELYVNGVLVNG